MFSGKSYLIWPLSLQAVTGSPTVNYTTDTLISEISLSEVDYFY
jgi:hypothetical protein